MEILIDSAFRDLADDGILGCDYGPLGGLVQAYNLFLRAELSYSGASKATLALP